MFEGPRLRGPFLYVTAPAYKASLIMVNCSVKQVMSVVINMSGFDCYSDYWSFRQ